MSLRTPCILLLAAFHLLVAGCKCPAVPVPAGQKCALGTPSAPALPRLFRSISKPPPNGRYAAAPICALPHSVSDECEVVDDVQAILGNGYDCANGSDVAV